MRDDIYIKRLQLHGIKVVVPKLLKNQLEVRRIITEELWEGIYDNKRSKDFLINTIIRQDFYRDQGAQACILGCTEFERIIKPDEIGDIPLFDSAQVHIEAVIQILLNQRKLTDFLPSTSKL